MLGVFLSAGDRALAARGGACAEDWLKAAMRLLTSTAGTASSPTSSDGMLAGRGQRWRSGMVGRAWIAATWIAVQHVAILR